MTDKAKFARNFQAGGFPAVLREVGAMLRARPFNPFAFFALAKMTESADLAEERSQPKQLRLAKARSHQAVRFCHWAKENCRGLSQGQPHRRRSASFTR